MLNLFSGPSKRMQDRSGAYGHLLPVRCLPHLLKARTALFYTRIYPRVLRLAVTPIMPSACASAATLMLPFHAEESATNAWGRRRISPLSKMELIDTVDFGQESSATHAIASAQKAPGNTVYSAQCR